MDEIEAIRPLKGARLLEIGSSRGLFLEAASRRGALVSGVEPVKADAAIAREKGFEIDEGLFPTSPSDRGPYDVIVFNDVFEHIPAPAEAIRAVEALLKDDGMAVINLPSSTGIFYKAAKLLTFLGVTGPFDRMWQRGMPSPHMTYFSPKSLQILVERKTSMRRIRSFPLASISRKGLYRRISGQSAGLSPMLMFSAVWALSFILPLLPSDIQVGIFTREPPPAE